MSTIQRIHARIANARRDYLHKASATISKNHALVSIEDLKVRNMSKSAAGSGAKGAAGAAAAGGGAAAGGCAAGACAGT